MIPTGNVTELEVPKVIGQYKSEVVPNSIPFGGDYDFNTAFQDMNGKVVLWEHMNHGLSRPDPKVYHSPLLEKNGKRVAVFLVVPIDPKFQTYAPPVFDPTHPSSLVH